MFRFNAYALTCCGVILSAALPPLGLYPLALLLCPLFVLVATSERWQAAFGYGFFFAVGFFTFYLVWLPLSFASPSIAGPFFWLLYPFMIALLGVFWGIVTALSRALGGYGRRTLWLLAIFWVLMEWLRAQGYFAFPWGTLGYMWLGTPFAQLADIAGVYGLSFITLAVCALISAPFVTNDGGVDGMTALRSSLLVVLILGLSFTYGSFRQRQLLGTSNENFAAPHHALLVQGNTDPEGRVEGGGSEKSLYLRLTQNALQEIGSDSENLDLVIYPEFVISDYSLSPDFADRDAIAINIANITYPAQLITGGGASEGNLLYNSVFSISERGILDRYDKKYLVPFGEQFFLINNPVFQPIYKAAFSMMGMGMLQSRAPGKYINPLELDSKDPNQTSPLLTATYICYESVFPQIAQQLVNKGASVLVNVSNDAWFGKGAGARQHFLMGSLRSIETRRFLLRVGNNGITGVIDPLGRVLVELPRAIQDTLLVNYNLRSGKTLYVRFGDWFVIVLLIAATVVSIASIRNGDNSYRRW